MNAPRIFAEARPVPATVVGAPAALPSKVRLTGVMPPPTVKMSPGSVPGLAAGTDLPPASGRSARRGWYAKST